MKHFTEVGLAPIVCFVIGTAAGQLLPALVLSFISFVIGELIHRRAVTEAKEEVIIPEICPPIQTAEHSGYPEARVINVQPPLRRILDGSDRRA